MQRASEHAKNLERLTDLVARSHRGRVLVFHGNASLTHDDVISQLRNDVSQKGVVLEAHCRSVDGALNPIRAIVDTLANTSSAVADSASLATLKARCIPTTEKSDASALLALVRGSQTRNNHYELVRRVLCDAANTQPTLVAIHDYQNADADTVALVDYLIEDVVHNYDSMGIGLGVAKRPVYLLTINSDSPEGRVALERLRGRQHIHAVAVEQMDGAALGQFLTQAELADKLLRITDGMPHKVRQLVELLPENLHALAQARLSELTEGELRILRFAAVYGQPITLGALARLAHADKTQATHLLETGFLEDGGAVPLGGDLLVQVHRAYLDNVSLCSADPEENREFHTRCADHLVSLYEISNDDALCDSISRHLISAERADDAVEYVLRAVDWLTHRGAIAGCQTLLMDAIAANPRHKTALLLRLVDTLSVMGNYSAALDICHKLTSEADATVLLRTARVHELSGDLATAEELLRNLQEMPELTDLQRQMVQCDLAECLMRRGDLQGAAQLCEQTLQSHDSQATQAGLVLRHTQGKLAFWRANWDDALHIYESLLQSMSPNEHQLLRAQVLHNIGLVGIRTGHYEMACRRIQEGLGLLDALGEYFQASVCRHNLAIAHEYRQNYAIAIQLFERCIEDFDRLGKQANLTGALNSLGDLFLTIGDVWRARKLLEQSSATAHANGLSYMCTFNQLRLAAVARFDGNHAKAMALVDDSFAAFEESGHVHEQAESALLKAQLHYDLGQLDDADAAVALVRELGNDEIRARGEIVAARIVLDSDAVGAHGLAMHAAHCLEAGGQRDGVIEALVVAITAAKNAGNQNEVDALQVRAERVLGEWRDRVPTYCQDAFDSLALVQSVASVAVIDKTPDVAERQTATVVELHRKRKSRKESTDTTGKFHQIVGDSPEMKKLVKMVQRLANAQAPILITGESGTGKELVAAAITAESDRHSKPFIRVNAAAFADTLLESELFGHEKGAFTGASSRKLGAFEEADGGTLFLDEIGDISSKTQVSLLRVLQEREIRRVGGRKSRKVDVRIICATNRDLEQMVSDGTFRLDLYYRIKGLTIDLPPLRARKDDIELLCNHTMDLLADQHGSRIGLTPEALDLFKRYQWPGNIRELQNVLRSVYFFAQGNEVTVDELLTYTLLSKANLKTARNSSSSPSVSDEDPLADGFDLAAAKKQLELVCIKKALKQTEGNITKAAGLLSMKRPRLSQKIKEYGINPRKEQE